MRSSTSGHSSRRKRSRSLTSSFFACPFGDVHAQSPAFFHESLVRQFLVGARDGDRIQLVLGRDLAHRGQGVAGLEHAVEHHRDDALLQLAVDGSAVAPLDCGHGFSPAVRMRSKAWRRIWRCGGGLLRHAAGRLARIGLVARAGTGQRGGGGDLRREGGGVGQRSTCRRGLEPRVRAWTCASSRRLAGGRRSSRGADLRPGSARPRIRLARAGSHQAQRQQPAVATKAEMVLWSLRFMANVLLWVIGVVGNYNTRLPSVNQVRPN